MINLLHIQSRQKGMVLILVLLIFAFAAIISAELSYQSHREVRRTANILHANEAYLYALGGETFAVQKLLADYKLDQESGLRADYLSEAWAVESQPYPVDGADESEAASGSVYLEIVNVVDEENPSQSEGQVIIIIEDLQARFNLNNVQFDVKGHASGKQQLEAVFNAVLSAGTQSSLSSEELLAGVPNDEQETLLTIETPRSDLVNAVVDWMDANQDSALFTGGEDDFYQDLQPPYRTADQLMIHVSELMAIKGFEEADYLLYNLLLPQRFPASEIVLENEEELQESEEQETYYDPATGTVTEPTSADVHWGHIQHYASTLPFPSKINVNTAPAIVLQALFSPEDANTIVQRREGSPYQVVDDVFLNLEHIKAEDRSKFKPYLSVSSRYFLVTSIATLSETKFTLQSKLHRAKDGKVRVLAREFSY